VRGFSTLIIPTFKKSKSIDQGVPRTNRVEKGLRASRPLRPSTRRLERDVALRVIRSAYRSPAGEGLDTKPMK
jgi:hypothetical protein